MEMSKLEESMSRLLIALVLAVVCVPMADVARATTYDLTSATLCTGRKVAREC